MGLVVLLLGGMLTSVGHAAAPPTQEEGQAYVIQADDWLSQLAEKYLGNANLWPRIVEATNTRAATDPRLAVIENPNLIEPGQTVFIPTERAPRPERVEPTAEGNSLDRLCQDPDPAVRAFCSEIPIAEVHFDPYEEAEFFTCASRSGLADVSLDPNKATILVPNDGDFDLRGITAAIKVGPDNASLIPRWPESRFDFPADYAGKYKLPVGEQRAIPLTKAFELIRAGELIWTGEHGSPGKAGLYQTDPILTCDPQADFEVVIGPFFPGE